MLNYMKILIVSDTHGRHTYLSETIERIGHIDMLLHLGDVEGGEEEIKEMAGCPTEIVSGNNDYFSQLDREKIIYLGDYVIMMTHGHRYRVNFEYDTIKDVARQRGANIVMFGHTHVPLIDMSSNDVIAINPGSITQPRQPGRRPTYIIMEMDRFGKAHFTLHYI